MNTQSIKSVVEFLKYRGLAISPLPEKVDLPGLVLVLSNKKDAYYVVTATDCSCPGASYRPGQRCKHQRKYFPEANPATSIKQTMAETLDHVDANLHRMPASYQRMVRAAREDAEAEPLEFKPKGGAFKPFLEG